MLRTPFIDCECNWKMTLVILDSFKFMDDPEWIYRLKVMLLYEGRLSMKVNGKLTEYKAPCIVYFNAKDTFEKIVPFNAKYKLVVFHPHVVNKYFTLENLQSTEKLDERVTKDFYYIEPFYYEINKRILSLDFVQSKFLLSIVKSIEDLLDYQKNNRWHFEARAYLIHMLFKVEMQLLDSMENHIGAFDLVGEVSAYIQSLYSEQITLECLCRRFNVNRTTLNNLFKETTGMTVIEYLLDIRLETSKHMLTQTKLNVSEISSFIGFKDPSYFSRQFKARLGVTPTMYRNNQRLRAIV